MESINYDEWYEGHLKAQIFLDKMDGVSDEIDDDDFDPDERDHHYD